MDERPVVVTDVHARSQTGGTIDRPRSRALVTVTKHSRMPPPGGRKGPHPFVFFGLIAASFGSFVLITKSRANSQPLSQSSRRPENPRTPLTASSREQLDSKPSWTR